jgi:hypothetical protein
MSPSSVGSEMSEPEECMVLVKKCLVCARIAIMTLSDKEGVSIGLNAHLHAQAFI